MSKHQQSTDRVPPEVRSPAPKLLDLKTVAAHLSVHYATARDFVLSGKLQGIRLGGRRRIQVRAEDLDAFIESSRMGVDSGPLSGPIDDTKPLTMATFERGPKLATGQPHQWRQRFARKA